MESKRKVGVAFQRRSGYSADRITVAAFAIAKPLLAQTGQKPANRSPTGLTQRVSFLSRTGQRINAVTEAFAAVTFQADEIDTTDFAELMGKPLDIWLATEFFKHHTRQFKKRPIAWQIQSRKFTARTSPAFACMLYYHNLDADTLPKLRSQYVAPLRQRLGSSCVALLAVLRRRSQ